MSNPKGTPENLIPFKPGQSGNPNGRPKGSGVRFYIKKKADEIPEDGDGKRTRGEMLADELWEDALTKNKKDRWAKRIVMCETDGKLVQPVQIEPININVKYTDKESENKTENGS